MNSGRAMGYLLLADGFDAGLDVLAAVLGAMASVFTSGVM
jgi:hypothetical protein